MGAGLAGEQGLQVRFRPKFVAPEADTDIQWCEFYGVLGELSEGQHFPDIGYDFQMRKPDVSISVSETLDLIRNDRADFKF